MEVTLAVLADAANLTQDGKLNVLGAFQSLLAPEAPCLLPQISLVIAVRFEIGEKGQPHHLTVRFLDGEMKQIWQTPQMPMFIPTEDPRINPEYYTILNLQQTQFLRYDTYTFQIYVDGDPSGRDVHLTVQPLIPPLAG